MKSSPQQQRNTQLAKIHIAKQQLGMDRDTYESMLWTLARVHSAKDLDSYGRNQVLEHLRSLGATFTRPKKAGRHPGPVRKSNKRLMSKIEAQLTELGYSWAYADGIAKKMFKVESVRFCNDGQLHAIAAALTYQQQRRS